MSHQSDEDFIKQEFQDYMKQEFERFKVMKLVDVLNEQLLLHIQETLPGGDRFRIDDIYANINQIDIDQIIKSFSTNFEQLHKKCMIAVGLRKRSSTTRSQSHVSSDSLISSDESFKRPPVPPPRKMRESVSSRHPNLFSRQASMLPSHPQQSQRPPLPPPRNRKVYVFGGNRNIQLLQKLLVNGLNGLLESLQNIFRKNGWVHVVNPKYHAYIRQSMYENNNSNDALGSILKYIQKWYYFNKRSYNQHSDGLAKVWATLWTMYREVTMCSGSNRRTTRASRWAGGRKIENKTKKSSKKRPVK